MKRTIRNLTTAFALLAASAFGAHAADVTLKLAGVLPADHFGTKITKEMISEIEGANVGIKIKFFPASQLGSGEELFADAKAGNVDIVFANLYPQADKRLEITSLPFLVTTKDELSKTYGDTSSPYNQIMGEILKDHGLKFLSSVGEGLIGVIATKQPKDIHGMGKKEMSIRVWSSQVTKATMELLGYQTTTMSWAEVFPAVQAGTMDGAICCTPEWAYNTFAKSDVGNTYIPYNAFTEQSAIYASRRAWGRMSDEQKAVVQKAATNAAAKVIDQAWGRSEGFVAKLREKNWTIVEFTQAQRDAIKAEVVEKIWPDVGKAVGQDLLDRLVKK